MLDLLVKNCKAYSMEREGEIYEAIGIEDGRITKLYPKLSDGFSEDAKNTIDMCGKTIIPGMTDSHFHFMATCALKQMALKISEIEEGRLVPNRIEDVGNKIIEFAVTKDASLPIACFNYVTASIEEDRLPNRQEIDKWLPNRVVIILSMDGHSSSYSTAALEKMGIDSKEHDGILIGEAHEFNIGKMNKVVMDALTFPMLAKNMQTVINEAIDYGITSIHCLEGYEDVKKDRALSFFMMFAGLAPIHIRTYIQYKDIRRVKKHLKKMSSPRVGGCGSWEVDGSISSKTAAFYESYLDNPNSIGQIYYTEECLTKMIRGALEVGCQPAAHVIGTRGIQTLLNAYETAGVNAQVRARIEHFEFPTMGQVQFAIDNLHTIFTVQPGYAWIDHCYQKSYEKYLRPEQYDRQIPLKSIFELGGILCGSSDSPVQDFNPFIQMHGMVNYPIEAEALSFYQALRTYTINGAYATFEENERGSLAIGKIADFAVLDQNPFMADKRHIKDIKVIQTYLAGQPARKLRMGTLKFFVAGLLNRNKI